MLNYNAVISTIRDIARDILRLKKVADLRSDRYTRIQGYNERIKDEEKHVTNEEENINNLKKDLARISFRKNLVEDNNPDKEELIKDYSDQETHIRKQIEASEKDLIRIKEDVNDTINILKEAKTKFETTNDELITKIQNGETKISANALDEKTLNLIEELIPNNFSDAIAQAMATPVQETETTETEDKKPSKKSSKVQETETTETEDKKSSK